MTEQQTELADDIERAACTILAQSYPRNDALTTWVRHITGERDYAGRMELEAFRAVLNKRAEGDYGSGRLARVRRALDALTASLASGVVSYRAEGRPEGDTVSAIMFGAEPVAMVSSSLAAEVASYARRVRELLLNEMPWEDED